MIISQGRLTNALEWLVCYNAKYLAEEKIEIASTNLAR
jgi:hypothetical protein